MNLYLNTLLFIFITPSWKKCIFSIAEYNKSKLRKLERGRHVYTNKWVVYIKDGADIIQKLAAKNNFIYHGQLGSLKDFYHLEHKSVRVRSHSTADGVHTLLASYPDVKWLKQQKIKKRVVRGYFSDPLFDQQWYINNDGRSRNKCKNVQGKYREDINIFPAWKSNISGKGIVVSIIDDGIEHTHPDLRKNYDSKASYDFNDNDNDPFPRYTSDNINRHGTRCAGEIAAESNNSICGVGVAFNAKLGGIRMLDGDITDAVEASSLGFRPNHIDIYSISWGPDDDGITVDGPGPLTKKVLREGVMHGRKGLGSIFVWATGNGGKYRDYCSCDGYLNSPYTISIGSVDMCGAKPWYAEECPSILAVTYSGKAADQAGIEISTTDLRGGCTTRHTGSSAAAPLAAGMFALTLEANPKLTWRDLQHIIVNTAKLVSPRDSSWQVNGAGHKVNPKFGFGALDAGNLVKAASDKNWKTSEPQRICETRKSFANMTMIPHDTIKTNLNASGCANTSDCVTKLEHVIVFITINKRDGRGKFEITLKSPSGTKSPLLKLRPLDRSGRGFQEWPFLTVFHWNENPLGVWNLIIKDNSLTYGKLVSWRLKFFGTCATGRPVPTNPVHPIPSSHASLHAGIGIITFVYLNLMILWGSSV